MMKSFASTALAAVILLSAGQASAEVVKINVGPTLNPFFLRLVCNRIATERGGRLVNAERAGPDKNGVCYVDVPKRVSNPGIVMTPGNVRQPIQNPPRQNQPIQQPPIQNQPIQNSTTGKLEMVNVGRLWSQEHANQRCKRIAKSKDATWTGLWKKHDSRGEAQCQLRRRPEFILKPVEAGRLWSDAHARYKCPRVAQEQKGTWTGQWQRNPQDSNKATCMVRVKNVRTVVKAVKTSRIWSEDHAKQHCAALAKQNKGVWSGQWRTAPDGTGICMIKMPHSVATATQNTAQSTQQQSAPVTQSFNRREVQAGDIWDQAHAERKCPVVARNAKGSWTGKWRKTGPGNKSVCTVRFGSGIVAQATRPAQQNNNATSQQAQQAPLTNTRTRNVAAGQIWDDKQAKTKCPVVAANNKARWTGKWKKTGPGHISVCEVSVSTATQPAQNQTQAQAPTNVRPGNGNFREVPAGGIWDQTHANRKCPVVAFNSKGRWTGKWRKINDKNDAVCEVDMSR